MRNMNTGDLTVFKVNSWFSKSKGDGQLVRDVAATVKGKTQLKRKFYYILNAQIFGCFWILL